MAQDCIIDANGCLVCPEIKAVPAVISTTTRSAALGWNAGANSIKELSGDVQLTIPMQLGVKSVVVGFKLKRTLIYSPIAVAYGFHFFSMGGKDYYHITESGIPKTEAALRDASDTFIIRRINGRVIYVVNTTNVYVSDTKSSGVMLVGACLYSAGDTVGLPDTSADPGIVTTPLKPNPISVIPSGGGTLSNQAINGEGYFYPDAGYNFYDLAQTATLFKLDVPSGVSNLVVDIANASVSDGKYYFYLQRGSIPSYVDVSYELTNFNSYKNPNYDYDSGYSSQTLASPEEGVYYLAVLPNSGTLIATFTADISMTYS